MKITRKAMSKDASLTKEAMTCGQPLVTNIHLWLLIRPIAVSCRAKSPNPIRPCHRTHGHPKALSYHMEINAAIPIRADLSVIKLPADLFLMHTLLVRNQLLPIGWRRAELFDPVRKVAVVPPWARPRFEFLAKPGLEKHATCSSDLRISRSVWRRRHRWCWWCVSRWIQRSIIWISWSLERRSLEFWLVCNVLRPQRDHIAAASSGKRMRRDEER